jgi:23S rRNA pseudouridine2605 synthase
LEQKIRLNKKIAESGIASRRGADRLIELGRVSVDGEIVTAPVFFVNAESEICVDGEKIGEKFEELIIWKFHKPRGIITTRSDPRNRKTVFDFLRKSAIGPHADRRLLCVGRLDYNSEGLLLFTNSGDMARRMELPCSGLKRVYRARILGRLTDEKIRELREGVIVDGIKYGSIDVSINSRNDNHPSISDGGSANSWITVTLSEGKNREIRKIMQHAGCVVNRLIRISYGPFNLGNLISGAVLRTPRRDVSALLKLLKAPRSLDLPLQQG